MKNRWSIPVLNVFAAITTIVLLISCNAQYFLLDTKSDSVFEYKDDFYVSKVDSTLELHYELWSQNASLWLSALNATNNLMFLITDSTYMIHNGAKYEFDMLVDWKDYSRQLAQIPNVDDYNIGTLYPVLPGRWKGMLGPPLPLAIADMEGIDPASKFDKSNSPVKISVQTCFYTYPLAYTHKCQRDTIWVESVTPIDGNMLRALENDREFKKADKFFVTNAYLN